MIGCAVVGLSTVVIVKELLSHKLLLLPLPSLLLLLLLIYIILYIYYKNRTQWYTVSLAVL